jgi:hypothetical protein
MFDNCFAIGNDELDELTPLDMDLDSFCPSCGGLMRLEYGTVDGVPDESIVFGVCSICDKLFLVGLNGKKLRWDR